MEVLPLLARTLLEDEYREGWRHPDFSDPQAGVTLRVTEGGREGRTSGSSALEDEAGVPWIRAASVRPEESVVVRVRLTAESLRKVIPDRSFPLFARYIALRELSECRALSPDDRIDLIEQASRDPSSALRTMGFIKAGEFMAREPSRAHRIVPLSIRGLNDPCVKVAHDAIGPLVLFFDLRDPETGKRYSDEISWIGRPEGFVKMLEGRIARVARSVHSICPEALPADRLRAVLEGLPRRP